jgi:hypothetical protein
MDQTDQAVYGARQARTTGAQEWSLPRVIAARLLPEASKARIN